MSSQKENSGAGKIGLTRSLFVAMLLALLAAASLVFWAFDVRTSHATPAPSQLLESIAQARRISTAASKRDQQVVDRSIPWTQAVDRVVAQASQLGDGRVADAAIRLAATRDASTVSRLSALADLEGEARAALAAADLDARRASGRVWLMGSSLLAALAVAGFAVAVSKARRLEVERQELDALLPPGHSFEGLVSRASRLSGRASSLVERHSSLVSERLGLVRVLADLEENERQLVAETRLHRDEIERLQVSQMRDELTGVLNFKYFLMRLSEALDEFITAQRMFCLLALDLDDFKGINDGYGHHVGDAALQAMGKLLADGARDGEIVFRKSGDEFYVLMPGASAAEAVRRAESLLATVNGHEVRYEAPGETYRVHLATSIGVLHCEQVDKKLLATLKRDQLLSETYGFADAALFKAKYNGKGCARIYTTGLTVVDVNPKEFPPDFDSIHRSLKSRYALLPDEAKDAFNSHLGEARRILTGR